MKNSPTKLPNTSSIFGLFQCHAPKPWPLPGFVTAGAGTTLTDRDQEDAAARLSPSTISLLRIGQIRLDAIMNGSQPD